MPWQIGQQKQKKNKKKKRRLWATKGGQSIVAANAKEQKPKSAGGFLESPLGWVVKHQIKVFISPLRGVEQACLGNRTM